MSKQERILTEEELQEIENNHMDIRPFRNQRVMNDIDNVIASHRSLLTANAALSFKNMELQTDLAAAKGNALLWRDKATIHQREIEELQNELAAEKAASEIWRRKLHKEANRDLSLLADGNVKLIKANFELQKALERIAVTFERGEMVRIAYDTLRSIKGVETE